MKTVLTSAMVALLLICNRAPRRNLSYQLITSGLDAVTFEIGFAGLAAGDVHGDGRLDIVTIGDHGSPRVNATEAGIMVWNNNGVGTNWTLMKEGIFGYGGVALGDVNNDGIIDIGYAMHHNYGSSDLGNQLIETALGNGSGTGWVPYDDGLATNGETYGIFGIDFADVNNDGRLDLASNSFGCCDGFRVYQNNGDGSWSPTFAKNGGAQVYYFDLTTSTWQSISSGLPTGGAQGIRLADMDMDGNPEVVLWSSRSISIYKADPNLNWSQIASFTIAETALAGMTIADFDHDGFNDVTYLASTGIGDNKLRVYLRVPGNPRLNLIPLFPKGSEHFISGSAQFVQWLSSVPPGDSATVAIQFSATGRNGPWTEVVKRAPNSNRYQWIVPKVDSSSCYLRYKITSSNATRKMTTLRPFSISTTQ